MSSILPVVEEACGEVFSTFFPADPPQVRLVDTVSTTFPADGRVVTVGVSGDWRGSIVVLYPAATLNTVIEAFLGMPLDDGMEEFADDALIEIGNQITARSAVGISDGDHGVVDITPPSLLCADGPMTLTWNRLESQTLVIGDELLRVVVGLSPGRHRAISA